ncbi:GPI mannosyltransferase 2 [Zychaea mexicana]|uniref:GPI mannosyltransferase 2 n=1 Tax=Zychaea mexicana TaxID=64656 RepID=UPI0022FDF057|nr:GPI mannosyltransferase 2 [Zychaea mexicana]KAI9491859.1 GPI mannosyltransferase 2 [Zychaea mexicana]
MKTLKHVYAFAIATRLTTIGIAILSYLVTGTYDSSADIQLGSSSLIQRCINVFLRWDALYFVHIARHGYVFEQEHAFFPGLPLAARFLSQTVLSPIQTSLGEQHTIVLAGALIANVSFVLAAGSLFKLTRSVFPGHPVLATVSAIAFCLSPPAMFMSSVYTESPFALLSFTGMLWYSQGRYLAACIVWGLASSIRSNAMIYSGFFIYDLVVRRLGKCSMVTGLIRAALYTMITLTGYIAVQYNGYQQFCPGRPWCDQTIPMLYSFVQKEYWNNGFLAYYEVKQIPNFFLALPIISLTVAGMWRYAQYDWLWFRSLGFRSSKDTAKEPTMGYTSRRAAPFVYLWGFLLLYATTCMHVQVIIRFFTSLPPLYWFTAQLWMDGFAKSSKLMQRRIANAVLSYYVLYGLVGIILFAAFLPPA